jgi:hypothetical protein
MGNPQQKSYGLPGRKLERLRREKAESLAIARRRARIKFYFGITLEEHEAILAQGCALCGATEGVVVDHDHRTRFVRAALCQRHNIGLGFFDDDPEKLEAAAQYIRNFRED